MLLSISACGYPGYDFNDDLSEPLLTLRFQGPADKDVKKRLKQKPTEDEEEHCGGGRLEEDVRVFRTVIYRE